MNNKSGTIYVIGEKEDESNSQTLFYKCGIVRDGTGRDSHIRLLEHQTGNPRKLVVVETISSPFVEYVETSIHYLWASKRVRGEWFQLLPKEVHMLIDSIKDIAKQVRVYGDDFNQAEILKNCISSGEKIPPSSESQYWYEQYNNFKFVKDTCDEILERYDSFLLDAIKKGVDVSGMAKMQVRSAPRVFDDELFASRFPDIFKRYSKEINEPKGTFRLTPLRDGIKDVVIGSAQVSIITDMNSALITADHSVENGFWLHEKHLAVLEIQKYAEMKCEIANAKLRVLTGESDGITGFCSWKREMISKIVFDRHKLQNDYPSEYDSCVSQGKDSEALIVQPMRAEKVAK